MFSPTDKNRFALSFLDIGDLADRRRRPVLHPRRPTPGSRPASRDGPRYGVSLHPDAARRTLFGAVGTGSSYVLVRSLDDGASWDLPLGPGTSSGGNLIAFDLDDPAYVFWGRHRNTSHGAGAWSPMSGLERRLRGLGLHAHGAGDGERAGALRARPRRQRLGGPPLARPRGDLDRGAGDALRQPQHLEQVRPLPRASARPERALHPRARTATSSGSGRSRSARRRAGPSWI